MQKMRIYLLLVLLSICIIPLASASGGFVYHSYTDDFVYQGEKIRGWLDNTEGEYTSVVSYVWNDGVETKHWIYAKGGVISGTRVQGAALYPYLPADGKWWKTSDGGISWQSTAGIYEVYTAPDTLSLSQAFYAGVPNQDNDLKTNQLSITIRSAADYPTTIQMITKTYYVKRLSPYVYLTAQSENPHIGGTDIATQTLQWNTSPDLHTINTIDHYYLTSSGHPQMGVRYQRKLNEYSTGFVDDSWMKADLDGVSQTFGSYYGEYTTFDALKAVFLTNDEGKYILRSAIYDYKGRSHYGTLQDREIEVKSTASYLRIKPQDLSDNPVVNNVYFTVKDASSQAIIYSGYMSGSYLQLSFNPPKTLTVQGTAPGYTPLLQTVTKNFTEGDNELVYRFEQLGSPSLSPFDTGSIRFIVYEKGTTTPLSGIKIVMEGYDYYTDANGVLEVQMPANGFGRVTPIINFGMASSIDHGIMGDWDGDGIDTFGIVRLNPSIGWYLATYNEDGTPYTTIQFGATTSGDTHPFTGDFNGDGNTSFGVYRHSKPELILGTSTGTVYTRFDYDLSTYYGSNYPDVKILTGDWNGDGKETIATYYNGVWRLWSENSASRSITQFTFGMAGDKPLVGDWNGDGIDTVGVRRGNLFILADSNSGSAKTFRFYYGFTGTNYFPLAGDFNGDGKDKIGIWDYNRAEFKLLTGGYNYEVRSSGRASVSGLVNVFPGETVPVTVYMERISTIPTPRPGDRPEGEGVGLLQVLTYLMTQQGIEDEEQQNNILGILIILFCVLLVGGLVAGSYGVLAGGIFGFILAVIVGFIPIWIPLSFIAIAGLYILLQGIGGN